MKTNMDEIKRIAKTLAYTTVNFDEQIPFIVHHPFFQTSVYTIGGEKFRMLDLTNCEERELAIKNVVKIIEKVKGISEFFMLVTKPYLPAFFKFTHKYMSEQDYAEFLSEMWTYVEFPNNDANISKLEFIKLFEKANKDFLMTKDELQYIEQMPEEITIYRGLNGKASVKALSWTTDISKAEWFANRFGGNGEVHSAKVNKRDILAYFTGRGESEVVVNFKKLREIQKI